MLEHVCLSRKESRDRGKRGKWEGAQSESLSYNKKTETFSSIWNNVISFIYLSPSSLRIHPVSLHLIFFMENYLLYWYPRAHAPLKAAFERPYCPCSMALPQLSSQWVLGKWKGVLTPVKRIQTHPVTRHTLPRGMSNFSPITHSLPHHPLLSSPHFSAPVKGYLYAICLAVSVFLLK